MIKGKFLEGSSRQLNDIASRPSRNDPRPHFELGELPADYPTLGETGPFRVLRWHPVTGEEVCATSPEQLDRYNADGYRAFPIQVAPKSRVDDVHDELAALSPEEREIVFTAQRQARLAAIQAKLSGLSDAELATVQGDVPIKRGPGRPRKTEE